MLSSTIAVEACGGARSSQLIAHQEARAEHVPTDSHMSVLRSLRTAVCTSFFSITRMSNVLCPPEVSCTYTHKYIITTTRTTLSNASSTQNM